MALPVGKDEREGVIRRFLTGLSFPKLFVLLLGLFFADLLMPDMIPFIDEMFLGALTVLFGMWRERKTARPGSGP